MIQIKRDKNKELLCKQLELLAEQSKGAPDEELTMLSGAMSEIYKLLLCPPQTPFVICIAVVNVYLIIGFLILIKKLFGSKS